MKKTIKAQSTIRYFKRRLDGMFEDDDPESEYKQVIPIDTDEDEMWLVEIYSAGEGRGGCYVTKDGRVIHGDFSLLSEEENPPTTLDELISYVADVTREINSRLKQQEMVMRVFKTMLMQNKREQENKDEPQNSS